MAGNWNIDVYMTWVPTTEQLADAASRVVDVKEAIIRTENLQLIETQLNMKFTLDGMATASNTKCKKFISISREDSAFKKDFFRTKEFGDDKIWVFPPQVIIADTFFHLQKYARRNDWAMLMLEYEMVSPLWAHVRNDKNYERHVLPSNNAILFPAERETEGLGFWKVPEKAKPTLIVHCAELRKRTSN